MRTYGALRTPTRKRTRALREPRRDPLTSSRFPSLAIIPPPRDKVRRGRVIRGQWFYATDEASRRHVWFHCVRDLVARAVAAEGVDVVDLGPSGSDGFSALKARFGFASVDDWTSVADYTSSGFYDYGEEGGPLRGLMSSLGL